VHVSDDVLGLNCVCVNAEKAWLRSLYGPSLLRARDGMDGWAEVRPRSVLRLITRMIGSGA
jgi:hypothetical protein